MSVSLIVPTLLFAKLNNVPWFDRLISSAALGVEKLQQFLQRLCVGGVAQEGALPPNLNESFVLELV
jgi:hypothetical protein